MSSYLTRSSNLVCFGKEEYQYLSDPWKFETVVHIPPLLNTSFRDLDTMLWEIFSFLLNSFAKASKERWRQNLALDFLQKNYFDHILQIIHSLTVWRSDKIVEDGGTDNASNNGPGRLVSPHWQWLLQCCARPLLWCILQCLQSCKMKMTNKINQTYNKLRPDLLVPFK